LTNLEAEEGMNLDIPEAPAYTENAMKGGGTMACVIKETGDYYPLSVLFQDSGMEIAPSHTPPAGLVKMWRLEDGGALLAAVTLEIRDGAAVLGRLGVRPDCQRQGYGKLLQKVVFEEARKMGLTELWGCAKVPDYYCRLGWERQDWDRSPRIAAPCENCPRRGKTCFPTVIRIQL